MRRSAMPLSQYALGPQSALTVHTVVVLFRMGLNWAQLWHQTLPEALEERELPLVCPVSGP